MIIRLDADNIVKYWDIIRFSALAVNPLVSEGRTNEYCRNLLKNLLSDKAQVWIGLDDNDRRITGICITRILLDAGEIKHLLLDVVYVFIPFTMEQKKDFLNHMLKFAENVGCDTVTAYTSNAMAGNASIKMGLKETHKIYSVSVGGV